jgi:hypothetical protein
LQYEALGHALAGEAHDFHAAIGHARELIETAGPATDEDWAVWCTPGYVTMHEASGWVELRGYVRAIAAYEMALADWPREFRRDQGVYYGRLAFAHAGAGSPEEAAEVGHKALHIATGTGSVRILAELRPLQAALASWQSLPLVRSFTADLQQALPEYIPQHPREINP